MAKLYFTLAEVLPILEHAGAAQAHRPSLGQTCEKEFWKPGATPGDYGFMPHEGMDMSKIPPQLFLVKDQGCYLMSAGNPGLKKSEGSDSHVVTYAFGCDPDKDEDWYDTCHDKCGGDDFGEALPVSMFRAAIADKPTAKKLVITLLKRSIRMAVV